MKSICKISYKDLFRTGTGFFIKLLTYGKELFCLMTNEHITTKEMIKSKEMIDVFYDFEKKMYK